MINKDKVIPDVKEYIKILLSSILTIYLFKSLIYIIFPFTKNLNEFWSLVLFIFVITYIKDLITIKYKGREIL